MITERQLDCLRFIESFMKKNEGLCPSYQQMCDGLGMASKSGIKRIVDGLEERGYIRRLKHRHQAIEIVKKGACPRCGYAESERDS